MKKTLKYFGSYPMSIIEQQTKGVKMNKISKQISILENDIIRLESKCNTELEICYIQEMKDLLQELTTKFLEEC